MKKLQIALDLFSTQSALDILKEVSEYIDIIELGTPLMIAEGVRVIKEVKRAYPQKTVFADIKVMDGGRIIPKIAFDAGADMVSVLAAADDDTVKGTIEIARSMGRKVLVDTCAVKDLLNRAKEIELMSPDYICVHVGTDVQTRGVDPIAQLRLLDSITTPKAIAGGITLDTVEAAAQSPATVIISGGGIVNQNNIAETAKKMRLILDKYS